MSALGGEYGAYLALVLAGFLPNEVWRWLAIGFSRGLDEDAEIGRLYLPGELLKHVGITTTDPSAAIADPRVDGASRALAALALQHFAAADRLMRSRPRGRLLAPRMMEAVYRALLRDMLAEGWAPPRRRVRIAKRRLLWILVRCILLG